MMTASSLEVEGGVTAPRLLQRSADRDQERSDPDSDSKSEDDEVLASESGGCYGAVKVSHCELDRYWYREKWFTREALEAIVKNSANYVTNFKLKTCNI